MTPKLLDHLYNVKYHSIRYSIQLAISRTVSRAFKNKVFTNDDIILADCFFDLVPKPVEIDGRQFSQRQHEVFSYMFGKKAFELFEMEERCRDLFSIGRCWISALRSPSFALNLYGNFEDDVKWKDVLAALCWDEEQIKIAHAEGIPLEDILV